jgi:SAM-dependent methyltransferase
VNWDSLDWPALDRLRKTFLAGSTKDYWRRRSDLENYDFTYGQRIAWKWNAVLAELRRLGWTPPATSVLDWGCGSGVAGRLVRDFFGLQTLRVFDRSERAMQYAVEAGPAERWRGEPPGVLVLSHVLNEVRVAPAVIHQADAVLWIEPGTHADSRALITVREQLREKFHVVAPCPHREKCGMLAPQNDRHWCHFFAEPPAGIMSDPNWVRFAQRAGLDLRSLPYSYLVLDRKTSPIGDARIIGQPRIYRGYAKLLRCRADGVREETIQQRDDPEFFRQLKKGVTSPASATDC